MAAWFNRRLKEQAIHQKILSNLEEARADVGTFVKGCDTHPPLEKLRLQTPVEARKEHFLHQEASR